ncbi:hypothetical protein ACFPRL_34810 [Pseudoclavibacter helvolus]
MRGSRGWHLRVRPCGPAGCGRAVPPVGRSSGSCGPALPSPAPPVVLQGAA